MVDDAGDKQKTKDIVQVPERAGDRAADQRGGKFDLRVRQQLIDKREREPDHKQRQQIKNNFADDRRLRDEILG